ncbi:MAG: GntR family transcriptional regulator [Sedimentisphaeraceae bacterium JB056]
MATHKLKKCDVIFNTIEREIKTDKYMFGFKLPSDKELCKRFNASRPTVARALNELESVGLVERKIGSGTFVKYNSPGLKKRFKFGLLVPGLGETEIFDQICGHLSHLAQTENFKLVWYGSMDSGPKERAAKLEQLAYRYIEEKVDGVFFTPLELVAEKEQINLRITEILKSHNINIVLIDRDIVDFPLRSEYDFVSLDNFRTGYVIAQHLIEQGAKRIAFVAKPFSAPSVFIRMAGYREAVIGSGLTCNENDVHIETPLDADTISKILRGKPDAVVCANDSTAAILMQGLLKKKVSVPDEIMVTGIDDLPYSKYLCPTLTTYQQPYKEIAKAALETMVHRIENEDSPAKGIQLAGKIIVRKSTQK